MDEIDRFEIERRLMNLQIKLQDLQLKLGEIDAELWRLFLYIRGKEESKFGSKPTMTPFEREGKQ